MEEAPTTTRRMPRWLPFAMVGAVLVTVAAVVVLPKVVGNLREPTDAANRYLAALRDGEIHTAYGMLCARMRADAFEEKFFRAGIESEAAEFGHVRKFRVTSTHADLFGDTATVRYAVETDKAGGLLDADLIEEAGEWRWCGSHSAEHENGFRIRVGIP